MKISKQNNRRVVFKYLVLILVLLWSVPTLSFGMSDIKADDVDFDLSEGEFTAKGNVKIDSEEVTLSADEVQAKVDGTLLLSITATGEPLELELEIDNEEEEGSQTIRASAKELMFNNAANWVEFIGEVQLQTDVAKIRAHKIRIELDTQKIVATKGEDDEQVEITLLDVETP
ncbi:MAG: hypothetical protein F4W92_01955 [Gammaproteobacteria bacterium]|nr:hypothetical protein [Gammaproteobacteria bacterium]